MGHAKADFDVVIIGGGPGGLSAALWCSDLGMSALLLEKEAELGGQLLITHNPIKNYLGVVAENGRELRDNFVRQVRESNATLRLNAEIVDLDADTLTVTLADGSRFSGRAIIIATGVRRRKLNIPGEAEFAGRGILDSGAASKDKVTGKQVVIIGGGDAALENALILSKTAEKVTVVHRREEFAARPEFLAAAKYHENIFFVVNSRVSAIRGSDRVESVEIITEKNDHPERIETETVLIRIGIEPNFELFRDRLHLDEKDFLMTDSSHLTNVTNVFAIGDVSNRVSPTISGACGQAADVAKWIRNKM